MKGSLVLKVSFKLLINCLVSIFVYLFLNKLGVTDSYVIAIFLVNLLVTVLIIYNSILKPIRKLNKALSIVDFNLDVIDFTRLDNYTYSGKDEIGVLVDKIKELSDVLVVRVDKVNEETFVSEHDELSGLYNRVRFDKVKRDYENCSSVCIIFLDLNNLKRMNDIFGHDAGDELIRKASKQLDYWSYKGDCYRMGGDEFMVVLTDLSQQECEKLVTRWYSKLKCINNSESDGFKCVFAYGMAYSDLCINIDELLREADEKMYQHKIKVKIANGEDPNSR